MNSDHLHQPESDLTYFFVSLRIMADIEALGLVGHARTGWIWTIFSLELLGFSCTRRRLACFPSLVLITALRRMKTNVEEKTCSRPAEGGKTKTCRRKGTWISRKASYKRPLLDSIMCTCPD